jgi:signal transduction histidine kinase/FixJ family two-component response regulator
MTVENKFDATQVLIIDDEQSLRDGAERILTRMGCNVLKADRGDRGLDIIEKEPVAIVLLDMKMPGMDGMEVLGRIMEMNLGILVIVITGYATVETAIEAMKKGAYDFIPKPYEPDQLRIVVNRAREKLQLSMEAEKLEEDRRKTLADLHMEQSRVHTIVESLPNGVLVTDTEGKVVLINPAFRQHLALTEEIGPGNRIEEFVTDKGLCSLVMDISRGKIVDFDDIPSHELDLPSGKFLLARARPVLGDRRQCLGAVVNIMDISAMKALDQLKSEFVAKVSHELRSPLSTIHEQLSLVLNDMEDEVAREAETEGNDQYILSRAKEKTKGLISTIGDLLDLSRIEAGIAAKEVRPVQIVELLENIVDFLGARAKAKGQSLVLDAPDEALPTLTADPMALESVFGNLITNAINYTQDGGEITARVTRSGSNLRVVIQDNGYGIEAKHMDKIFDRFYRVKNEKTRYITGTGLGLPIVKGIVDSMGGFIDVESESDQGTTFTVILPVKA